MFRKVVGVRVWVVRVGSKFNSFELGFDSLVLRLLLLRICCGDVVILFVVSAGGCVQNYVLVFPVNSYEVALFTYGKWLQSRTLIMGRRDSERFHLLQARTNSK